MKKTILTFTLLICTVSIFLNAQTIDINWTDKMIYHNKLDGFFQSYVGVNSKYIYATFNNLSVTSNKKLKKFKLIAFDKNNMGKECRLTI